MTALQIGDGSTQKNLEKLLDENGEYSSYISIEAAEVYDAGYGGNSAVLLRIGNGGAGQSGLVKGM
jgi:hypothetical protein